MSPYDSDDLDEILSDVRRLLGEDGADGGDVPPEGPAAPSHKAVSDETQQYTPIHMPQHSKPVPPWEQPDFAGEYFFRPQVGGGYRNTRFPFEHHGKRDRYAYRLRKGCSERRSGRSHTEHAHKQIIKQNIRGAGDCDKTHGTF